MFILPLVVNFGAAKSGQSSPVANVGYTLYDAHGIAQIPRTTEGVTEDTDANGQMNTGIYLASPLVDPTWFPVRVKWDITGLSGVSASEVIVLGSTTQITAPPLVSGENALFRYDFAGNRIGV